MRKTFHQYFKPTKDELTELWQQGLFSFDASVLLNIYGYSKKTREELVKFIEEKAARVRLPYQFGLEYSRRRSSVIVRQVHNYLKVEEGLRKIKETDIAPKRDHPFLSKKSARAFDAILTELEESRKAMEKLIGNDPYAEKMFDVFDGRIGKCPTREQLSQMEQEAQNRYDKRVPPGFADIQKKGVPEAYGDCIAWLQLIEIAKSEQKGFVLVVDDFKEDWWLIEKSRTVGPRPELIEEFSRVTGQQLYIYTSENFLRAAKEFTSAEILDDVIEEVSQRLASQRQTEPQEELKSVPGKLTMPQFVDLVDEFEAKITESKSRPVGDSFPNADKRNPDKKLKREESDGG